MARKTRKPRVTTNAVADKYAAPNEKIIEYSYPDGSTAVPGGLISFRWQATPNAPEDGVDHGVLLVNVYGHSKGVKVVVSKGEEDQ